jgi:integrase
MAKNQNGAVEPIVTIRTARLRTNAGGVYEVWFSEPIPGTKRYRSKRNSCRTTDPAQAQAYLAAFIESERERMFKLTRHVHQPTDAGPQDRKVEELCVRWLEHAQLMGKNVSNGYSLASIRRLLGHLPISKVTPDVLAEYQVRRNMKPGTLLRELGALRTVMRWAANKRKYIPKDAVPEFEMPPKSEPRDVYLDKASEQVFWDQAMQLGQNTRHRTSCAAERRVKLFIALGLETAARRQAIYDLTWDRVDLIQRRIDYRIAGRQISNKKRVVVPISDRLLPVLQDAHARAPRDAQGRPTGRVLGEAGCIRRAFRDFAEGLGMGWVTPHVLRHTWATLAAQNGVPVWDIAAILGDDVKTVADTYLHHAPDRLMNVVNHRATPHAYVSQGVVP